MLVLMGCARPGSPCLVGYSVGAQGGKAKSLIKERRHFFVGVGVVLHYSFATQCNPNPPVRIKR